MRQIHHSLLVCTLLLTSNLSATTTPNTTDTNNPLERDYANLTISTTNQTTQMAKNSTANVTVITETEIEESGDHTVSELLSRVAGVSLTSNGGVGQRSTLFVRGRDSGNILILLDGMRLNDPSTTNGAANIEHILTETISQVEIVKGGGSSIWGSNASAGVINIISKKAAKGFHGQASFVGGSDNTTGTNLNLAYGGDALSASLSASILDSSGYSALVPREAEADGYHNETLNMKLGYEFNENNRIDLNYYHIDANGDYDDSWSMALADDNYSNYTSVQENIALSYRYTRDDFESLLKASQGSFERDYYTTSSFGDAQNQYRSTIKELSLISAYNYNNGKIVLGLEAKDIEGTNTYISSFPAMPSEAAYENRAVFLSNTYHLGEQTLIEASLRYDDFDAFDSKTTYKIGLKRENDFMDGLLASANYYTAYDSPSSYQLANATFGTLLIPSYTSGFDISLGYQRLLTVTYFDTKSEDTIDYDMTNYGYYNVIGEEKFTGIEVSSEYKIPSLSLALSASYTHLMTYEKHDQTTLSNRAKDTANISANYFVNSGTQLGITGQYIGDRVDISSEQTGNYTLLHANFTTDLQDGFKLSLYAKNLLDEEYQTVYGYATEGRSFYAKVSYEF